MCKSEFTTENFLCKHIERVHNKNKCPICKYIFENQDSLNRHFELDHPFETVKEDPFHCPICNYGFRSKRGVNQHITLAHEKEKNHHINHMCSICRINFSRAGYLKRHYETSHKELNDAGQNIAVINQNSGQNSGQSSGQNSRQSSEENNGQNSGQSSEQNSRKNSAKKRHIEVEHGNLLFRCVFCIYFCKSKDELLAHVKMSHQEMRNSPKQSLATLGKKRTK